MAGEARLTRESVLRWAAWYVAVGVLTAAIQRDPGQAAWYPGIGVGVALLLLGGLRLWPVVLAAELIVSIAQHGNVPGGLISAIVTTAEGVTVVAVLRRAHFRRTFERIEDVVLFAVVAAAVTMAGAAVGNLLVELIDRTQWTFSQGWGLWAIGDLSGIVLVTPALLVYRRRPRVDRRALRRSHAEQLVVSVVAIAAVAVYFLTANVHALDLLHAGPFTLCLLPLGWAAVRFDIARTAILVTAVDTAAVVAYAGVGPHLPFGPSRTPDSLDLVTLQLPIVVVGLSSLAVAAAIGEVRRTLIRETALIDSSPAAIISIDHRGRVLTWNDAAERIFGYTAEEAIGNPPPVVLAENVEEYKSWIGEPETANLAEVRHLRHKDGHLVIGRLFTSRITLPGGQIGGVGVIEDITIETEAQERQAFLYTAFDQAGEAIFVTTPEPTIVYANPAALATSGYTLDELVGQNPRILKSGEHHLEFYEQMWAKLVAGERWHGVLINKRKNGEFYEERTTIGPVFNADRELIAYVAVKHDLSRERLLEADLRVNLEIRSTALLVMQHVERQGTAEETAQLLSDRVALVTGAEAFVARIRPDGSVSLLAAHGDAVAGLAQWDLPPDMAAPYIARLEQGSWVSRPTAPVVPNSSWSTHLRPNNVTATLQAAIRSEGRLVGLLVLATQSANGEAWMDEHLDLADELGSFAAVLIGSQLDELNEHELTLRRITGIIERTEFHTAFQPWVSLDTDEICGHEALTRFDDGTRPDVMITAAWAVGLGSELEAACARVAVETANELLPGMTLSLNFSPETIMAGLAAAVVAEAHCPIVIEVTEHTPIHDYPALRTALDACGRIKVSVDDAGAGYASMRHILELHPHVVKLDIGLIRNIDHDLGRQALAAGLCHYAAQTGTVLIAEGIETAGEAAAVRALGVHHAQGYYFGRPTRTPVTTVSQ